MTTAVVFTCAHASPKVDNNRFDLLGNLIFDIRPDYVFDLGDFADMSSLNSYDTRYPKAIVSQSYQEDIECTLDAQEKLRDKFVRRKVRKPIWIGFEGNHENRIKKALQHDPRLEGKKYGISLTTYKQIVGTMNITIMRMVHLQSSLTMELITHTMFPLATTVLR